MLVRKYDLNFELPGLTSLVPLAECGARSLKNKEHIQVKFG